MYHHVHLFRGSLTFPVWNKSDKLDLLLKQYSNDSIILKFLIFVKLFTFHSYIILNHKILFVFKNNLFYFISN